MDLIFFNECRNHFINLLSLFIFTLCGLLKPTPHLCDLWHLRLLFSIVYQFQKKKNKIENALSGLSYLLFTNWLWINFSQSSNGLNCSKISIQRWKEKNWAACHCFNNQNPILIQTFRYAYMKIYSTTRKKKQRTHSHKMWL